jgi:predicted regulator of amino acid metabolism with ACT domain
MGIVFDSITTTRIWPNVFPIPSATTIPSRTNFSIIVKTNNLSRAIRVFIKVSSTLSKTAISYVFYFLLEFKDLKAVNKLVPVKESLIPL